MSFDLTNKNISDTFQNLLQKTGSEGHLYDLEGNLVDNLTINTISSSVITASVLEIPKTKNGKLVELAVKQSVEGEAIKNLEALANPDSLEQFKNIKELNE